ncbi:MAG TPA: glycoside hydrolase family 2 TIM barrel-domain containing protein [Solirubrobacteraceae bacterium]|nr:glycoside hydrolase family 2 TIM barrel-domain containing protein [Solirubrobacteraceae bacterium]
MIYDWGGGWRFGGPYLAGSEAPDFHGVGFAEVTVPHTVTGLSWGDWDPREWERTWVYRRHFDGAEAAGGRAFVDFQGVMTNATVYLGGVELDRHEGGYLPFSVELTPHLLAGENVLAVVVDATWLEVPPSGDRGGAAAVDYLQPGGIYRDVALRVVPEVFLADVFAKPTDVLGAARRVDLVATIDAARVPAGPVTITAELLDGSRGLAATSATAPVVATGRTEVALTLGGLDEVELTLWSPDTPKLYAIRTTLTGPDSEPHTVDVRTGFREARFELDGFHLNGRRLQIFGLNRHQLFPYTGMAAPARLQRRDAELLRRELNCNMVRCSHYPPSPHFLDACDELGLMVWEEPPGWQYVGGEEFQRRFLENVRDMVIRDRSRPSVIVWATRLNESANHPALYARARRLAHSLDDSRPASGAVDFRSTSGWTEEVFAYDDYPSSRGRATLEPPIPGVPYLVSEAVGALAGAPLYRWIDPAETLALQAEMHARVHDLAGSDPAYAGVLGWAGIDYASLHGGKRIWRALKWPGVLDTFRVPKPGAAIYRSQVDPSVRAVILPVFFWGFGPGSSRRGARRGPGPGSMIATNCERLELFLAGAHFATAMPDAAGFPHLRYPPAYVDLTVARGRAGELRIDGYVGDELVGSVRMSADPTRDRLGLVVEDAAIAADGSDMTRITFCALDAYGNQRPGATGEVTLTLTGPGTLIGQNPFAFGLYGGVGGAFVRSQAGCGGVITVTAEHPGLGRARGRLDAG